MLKHLAILLAIIVLAATDTNLNKVNSKETIENQLFCGCTDKSEVKPISTKTRTRDTFWKKINNLLKTKKPLDNELESSTCLNKNSIISCSDTSKTIKIILTSVGTHVNSCNKNSTFESLHSTGKNVCNESIKSTLIAERLCNKKNKCALTMSKHFKGLCQDNNENKYLNIVYSCVDKTDREKKLTRVKRLNKFEKDTKTRDSTKFGAFLNLPFRWDYDTMQPYSFRNNRAMWGTGLYDYYNYFNYYDGDYGELVDDYYGEYYGDYLGDYPYDYYYYDDYYY